MLEELDVETREIPQVDILLQFVGMTLLQQFEGIDDGPLIYTVVGEDTEAQFVESRLIQSLVGLFLTLVVTVYPCVGGGSYGMIQRAVGVDEVLILACLHHSLLCGKRISTDQTTFLHVQFFLG